MIFSVFSQIADSRNFNISFKLKLIFLEHTVIEIFVPPIFTFL